MYFPSPKGYCNRETIWNQRKRGDCQLPPENTCRVSCWKFSNVEEQLGCEVIRVSTTANTLKRGIIQSCRTSGRQEERNSTWTCQSAKAKRKPQKLWSFSWEKTVQWREGTQKKKNSENIPVDKLFSLWKCTCNTCGGMPATSPQHCGGPAGVQPRDRPWFTADCLKHRIMRLQTWCDAQPKIQ